MLVLTVAAFYAPLTLLAEHWIVITRGYRLAIAGVMILVAAWIVAAVLSSYLGSYNAATNVTALLVVFFTLGGKMARGLPGGYLFVAGLVVASVVLAVALRRSKVVDVVVGWLVVTLGLGIMAGIAIGAFSYTSLPISSSVQSNLDVDPGLGDVAVIIFDEYPSAEVALEQGVDMDRHMSDLEDLGFNIYPKLPVNYSFTELSLPAFFLLDLPVVEGASLENRDRHGLFASIGGDSPFVRAFINSGYSVTLVESGWSGIRCMRVVDECVVRSWYDEVTATMLADSALSPLIDRFGSPFTHGVSRTLKWLDDNLASFQSNGTLDLLVVHLMLPHTPTVFDASCKVIDSTGSRGEQAWADQVSCSNRVMKRIAETTSDFGVVVLMGDHGSQLQGQIDLPPEQWTPSMVRERMNTFGAVRGLQECSEPRATSLTSLAIRLIRCVAGSSELESIGDLSLVTSTRGEPLVSFNPGSGERR